MSFKLGKKKTRLPIRPTATRIVNELMQDVLVPSEFSRRTRNLELTCKAEEFRNILCFYFVILIDAISEEDNPGLKRLFATLAYISRMYYTNDDEYNEVSPTKRVKIIKQFMEKFVKIYGESYCTYNFHQFIHYEKYRQKGPFPDTSAIPFEGAFAETQKLYRSGTRSVEKQILTGQYTRHQNTHSCKKSLRVEPEGRKTKKVDDSWLYKFENHRYSFFLVRQREEDNVWVSEVDVETAIISGNDPLLQWGKIGVKKFWYAKTETKKENLHTFTGKAIVVATRCDKFIMSVSNNILHEK